MCILARFGGGVAGCTAVLRIWGIMGSSDAAVGDNHGGSMGVVTKTLNFKSVLNVGVTGWGQGRVGAGIWSLHPDLKTHEVFGNSGFLCLWEACPLLLF